MLPEWVDAAFPPTPAQARQTLALGYMACGFYIHVPGSIELNAWTLPQKQVLDEAGLLAVPIIVPPYDLSVDPVETAQAAYVTAIAYGLHPTCTVLYSGNHIEQTGGVTGGLWLPIPGNPPLAVGALSAIQWGGTTIAGWDVDVNTAAADFPFHNCIAVDYEHATAPDGGWYKQFQTEITILGGITDMTALPESAIPVKAFQFSRSADRNLTDVMMLGNDGHVYHRYFDQNVTPMAWSAPEDLT